MQHINQKKSGRYMAAKRNRHLPTSSLRLIPPKRVTVTGIVTKLVPVIIAFIFLLPLTACKSQEETSEPDINYISYSDEELGVTLAYPEEWVTSGGFGGLTVASSQEAIDGESLADLGDNGFVLVIPGELGLFNKQTGQSFGKEDVVQVLNVYKQLLEREGQTYVGIEPPQKITIEGLPAAVMVARSEEDGTPLITILGVIMDDDYMALISAASLEPTAGTMRPIFDRIINSIQITNPYVTE